MMISQRAHWTRQALAIIMDSSDVRKKLISVGAIELRVHGAWGKRIADLLHRITLLLFAAFGVLVYMPVMCKLHAHLY